MTNEIKISRFNPCDYMESDEEIVDYLVDSYFDDPDGYVYTRACQFVTEAKGPSLLTDSFIVQSRRSVDARNDIALKQNTLSLKKQSTREPAARGLFFAPVHMFSYLWHEYVCICFAESTYR